MSKHSEDNKAIYQRWWFCLIVVLFGILGVIGSLSNSEIENKAKSNNDINSNIVYATNKGKVKN